MATVKQQVVSNESRFRAGRRYSLRAPIRAPANPAPTPQLVPLRSSPAFFIDDRSRRTPSSSPAQDSGPSSHERGFESRWGRYSI